MYHSLFSFEPFTASHFGKRSSSSAKRPAGKPQKFMETRESRGTFTGFASSSRFSAMSPTLTSFVISVTPRSLPSGAMSQMPRATLPFSLSVRSSLKPTMARCILPSSAGAEERNAASFAKASRP